MLLQLDAFILGKGKYPGFGKGILDNSSEMILIHGDSKATMTIKQSGGLQISSRKWCFRVIPC